MYEKETLKIQVPEPVREILNTLKRGGFEAYIVGGCVRDAILGLEPKDWDITTSALPEQVKSLFSNTADTGIRHGTVMVIRHGIGYEVTTYRIDGEYKDGRHPEKVSFTRSLAEDLKRRDFTINAFAFDPETGIVDLFDGIKDLNGRLIRCVGDPDARFQEDALRIMRAVRLSAQLSFRIETKTCAAIKRHVRNLERVSMERIRTEFEKTLLSDQPEKVNQYALLGMQPYMIPDAELSEKCFDPEHADVYRAVPGGEKEKKVLRLAVFFRNLEAEEARAALRLMKYDNKTIRLVSGIIKYKDREIPADKISVKRALREMGPELFEYTLSYRNAVSEGSAEALQKLSRQIAKEKEPFALSHLALNGKDLIAAGVPKGVRVGEALNGLLEEVIADPALNDKETLLELIQSKGGPYEL